MCGSATPTSFLTGSPARVHEVLYAAGDMIGTYMRLILHYVKPSCTVMTLNDDENSIGEPESNFENYV